MAFGMALEPKLPLVVVLKTTTTTADLVDLEPWQRNLHKQFFPWTHLVCLKLDLVKVLSLQTEIYFRNKLLRGMKIKVSILNELCCK